MFFMRSGLVNLSLPLRKTAVTAAVAVCCTCPNHPAPAQQDDRCAPQWEPTFGPRPQLDNYILTMGMFDDGAVDGPAFYVAGRFTSIGGAAANRIARWDDGAATWRALGTGMSSGEVSALAQFDDGGGPALHAAGTFISAGGVTVNCIARWNPGEPGSWSSLAGGVTSDEAARIDALLVHDDGGGGALYAGGSFTHAGGVAANNIAKWDGANWSAVGDGLNGAVEALITFDDGTGASPALYAGGRFLFGAKKEYILARWNGLDWSPIIAATGKDESIRTLAVFDDVAGGGQVLYAGGVFGSGQRGTPQNIATWDGVNWSPVGNGLNGGVNALAIFDDGGGLALFAALSDNEGVNIARWDPGAGIWQYIGAEADTQVFCLAALDDGAAEPTLLAGAQQPSGGSATGVLRKYVPSTRRWLPFENGVDGPVSAMAVFDDGTGGGPALFAGGDFFFADRVELNRIGKWDGEGWSALETGVSGAVNTMAVFDDNGDGVNELFVGGRFASASNLLVNKIAKWGGIRWSALAGGVGSFPADAVLAIVVFDDGEGADLYAGGSFLTAGGVLAYNVARWDGAGWSPLGNGTTGAVRALAVFDDQSGEGPSLYAAGNFSGAGDLDAVRHIARWDGKKWHSVGGGTNGSFILSMVVFDDQLGGGPALYVGGYFSMAGEIPANHVARWNGASWSSLAGGVTGTLAVVNTLAIYQSSDAGLPALYIGGFFSNVDGLPAKSVARWDGLSWSRLGPGIDVLGQGVNALAQFDDGSGLGPALYAGGNFTSSPRGDSYLARWQGCPVEIRPGDLNGDGVVDATDVQRMFAQWGACAAPCPPSCNADIGGAIRAEPDCVVDIYDLFLLLANWSG